MEEKVISYDSSRGGVSVITEKGEVTTSYLLIQNAELSDSGKYSCSPSNADVASVRVYVLNGLLVQLKGKQTGARGMNTDHKGNLNQAKEESIDQIWFVFKGTYRPKGLQVLCKMVTCRPKAGTELSQMEAFRLDSHWCGAKVKWNFGKKKYTPDKGTNLNLPFIDSLSNCKSNALNHVATKVGGFASATFADTMSAGRGERPAAMQTGSAGLSNSSLNIVTLILLCLLYSFVLEEIQLNNTHFCARLRER
uniref:Ig-like domain-containing protein n=1 Tax=Timema poppense TaxID=170557 RepID=A0A7R9H381_TIMPO|nr:unnamed protein product [Timema poppensis]